MANEDKKVERRFSETNPSIYPILRDYFTALNTAVESVGGWRTTTTTSTTSTTTTSTTSSTTTTTTA